MCLLKMSGKKKSLIKKHLVPKSYLDGSILERLWYKPLSERDNELLNKNAGYRNTAELEDPYKNAVTKEEYDKLFIRIRKRVDILEKLAKKLSKSTEKKNQ